LHDIDRTENGWPTSAAIGLALAPDEFLDLIAPALDAANGDRLSEFALVLLGAEDAALDKVLRSVAAQRTLLRDKLAAAIKTEVETKEQSRQKLLALGFALPPTEDAHERWRRYAALLGVAA
jgi:hypothetical protein